jgi:hypothetical protein
VYGDVAVFVHPLALAIFSAHACFMLTMHTRRGWMTPVRHALGALLLEQGRVAEAAQAYREDLAPGRHPENVWALHGLVLRNCITRSLCRTQIGCGEAARGSG